MRYHHEQPELYTTKHGIMYICDHPVYDECTLYLIGDKGLAVIQQKYDSWRKRTWWGPVDECLQDQIYLHPKFKEYFDKMAKPCKDGLYPTVALRQIMWAMRMKPLAKEIWETTFTRCPI